MKRKQHVSMYSKNPVFYSNNYELLSVSSLHEIPIQGDQYTHSHPQQDYSQLHTTPQVFFKHIETHLLQFISESDYIVGCVAWLTNFNILNALSSCKGVAFIIQKEEFLRPESHSPQWIKKLKTTYEALPCSLSRYDFFETRNLSVCGDPTLDPVRCVGSIKQKGSITVPRMHHKFIVSGHLDLIRNEYMDEDGTIESSDEISTFIPTRVWTGSYNFSHNAECSFENCIVLDDQNIAQAYLSEWGQLEALSEQLDWTTPWIEPDWRIGT